MRRAIFGGTFDPVHLGHLLLAEACREQLSLDEVLFLPAAVSPLKQTDPPSAGKDRLEMLKLAIAGQSHFRVDDRELNRGGVSYTVDTLEELRREFPDDELFLPLGSDALASFPHWHRPDDVGRLATIVPINRSGAQLAGLTELEPILGSAAVELMQRNWIQMPEIDLSSTDIRQRVRSGKSIRFRTPRAVEQYIVEHKLYRS